MIVEAAAPRGVSCILCFKSFRLSKQGQGDVWGVRDKQKERKIHKKYVVERR
jgi:hypothetical protein